VYFLALLVSDSARASLAMSELVLGGAIVVLLRRRRVQRDIENDASWNRAYAWCAAITAIVAAAAFLFALDLERRGGLMRWRCGT